MCGIFAYVGGTQDKFAPRSVFTGLKKLEYRGYDSWGIAVLSKDGIFVTKQVGKLSSAPDLPESNISVGHTRWATHGGVTQKNAHPHYSSDKSFAVVHNGIVENYLKLKRSLESSGHTFISETDTEVIVKLIELSFGKNFDLVKSVRHAYSQITGRNTIAVISKSGVVIGARDGSPLVFGVSKNDNAYFLSSDTYSFANEVKAIHVLGNRQVIILNGSKPKLLDLNKGTNIPLKLEELKLSGDSETVGKYGHFMLKEIYDTPKSLLSLTKVENAKYQKLAKEIKKAKNVYVIGSGTAGNAAAEVAYFLRKYSKVNAISLIGSDCNEFWKLFSEKDLIIALSQSGETADVLEVLEVAKKKKMKIASFVNMPGSMMTRMSDISFMAGAGPELCVLSTKVFTSQIAWGYIVAKTVAGSVAGAKKEISHALELINKLLHNKSWLDGIKKTSHYLSSKSDLFLLGKADYFPIVKEGMVKIIEGSYIHAHAIPAGDLKHYAITLIEDGVDVLSVIPENELKSDIINSLSQVKARGAFVIGVSPTSNPLFNIWLKIPKSENTSSILSIIPFQLIAYYLALYLGHDVDRPRNIAKSVTVK